MKFLAQRQETESGGKTWRVTHLSQLFQNSCFPMASGHEGHTEDTWCCDQDLTSILPANTSLPCKSGSQVRGEKTIHLPGVFCSLNCSKDSRTLFVLKQGTSLLQPHLPDLTGQPGSQPDLEADPVTLCRCPPHPCPASGVLVWFCFQGGFTPHLRALCSPDFALR